MIRLGILGSTRGTHLLSLIDAISQKRLSANIQVVMSNRPHAMILERARMHHLNAQFIDPLHLTREAYDREVSHSLHLHAVELVVLIGYMRILSEQFVLEWQHRIINVHPSLLPAHAGKMDLDVHRSVIAAGEKETGCTVHYVTQAVDAGPLIIQKKCAVLAEDTPESLKARVQELEADALVEAIDLVINQKS